MPRGEREGNAGWYVHTIQWDPIAEDAVMRSPVSGMTLFIHGSPTFDAQDNDGLRLCYSTQTPQGTYTSYNISERFIKSQLGHNRRAVRQEWR